MILYIYIYIVVIVCLSTVDVAHPPSIDVVGLSMSSMIISVINVVNDVVCRQWTSPLVVGQCRPPASVCPSSVRSSSVDVTSRCLPVRPSVRQRCRPPVVRPSLSVDRKREHNYLYYKLTMFEPFLSILFHPISPIIVTDLLIQSVLCIDKNRSNKQISKLKE